MATNAQLLATLLEVWDRVKDGRLECTRTELRKFIKPLEADLEEYRVEKDKGDIRRLNETHVMSWRPKE